MNASLPSACSIQDSAKGTVPPMVGEASLLFLCSQDSPPKARPLARLIQTASLSFSSQGSLHDVTLTKLSHYVVDLGGSLRLGYSDSQRVEGGTVCVEHRLR